MRAAEKATAPALAPGTAVDGYVVVRELHGHHAAELRYAVSGEDGSRATLVASPRPYAGRAERARFHRLAARRAKLGHPAAIPVRLVSERGDRPILVTDAYPERTFASVLDEEAPVAPERLVAMLAPVAKALDLAYSRGLVQASLTADSLLLTGDDRLLLDTLGLVADRDAPERSLARARDLRYRPPEEAGNEPLGPTANVYALAALVVHALRGAAPYEGERRTTVYALEVERPSRADTMARQIAHALTRNARFGLATQPIFSPQLTTVSPRVSDQMPHLGKAIDAVVARGLAEQPSKRQASAAQLMKEVAGSLGVAWPDSARPALPRPPLQLVTERMQPVPRGFAPTAGGRRAALVAMGAAAVIACGALAALALTPFGNDRPAQARAPVHTAAWGRLGDRRADMRDQLAGARTPSAQAGAASQLAGLYSGAARAGGPRVLRRAAHEAGSAYAQLAAAAENRDADGYARAAGAVDQAERALVTAASRR